MKSLTKVKICARFEKDNAERVGRSKLLSQLFSKEGKGAHEGGSWFGLGNNKTSGIYVREKKVKERCNKGC